MKQHIYFIMLLKVAYLIRQMPVGQGWVITKDFVTWTPLSKSTVYRLLPKMVNAGLLEQKEHKKGKRKFFEYKMTNVGNEFFLSQKELF